MHKQLLLFVATVLILAGLSHVDAQIRDTIPPDDGETTVVREYALTLDAGETITIQVDRISGTLQPFIGIADGEGRVIVRQSAEGEATNRLTYSADDSGVYQVQVIADPDTEASTYGDFVLTIERETNNDQEVNAPFIANDDPLVIISQLRTFRGAITDADPEDFYDIFIDHSTTVILELYRMTGGLNPQVAVVDPSGRVLARGSVVDSFSTAIFEVEASGWYRIVATRFDPVDISTQGDYRLEIMTD
jgi:hypothetical protein